jgi:hypothetical protein
MREKGRHRPKRMDRTIKCGHVDRPFFSKGKCRICYMVTYHEDNKETLREKQKKYLSTHKEDKARYDKTRRDARKAEQQ